MTGAQAAVTPLDGVRVLEVGRGRSTPFAARVLADLGADVTKVESPEGDPTRGIAPHYVTDSGEERGALFEYLNWNKSAISLDPATQRGELDRLIARTDVLLVGDDLAQLRRWRLDPDGLLDAAPDLVVVTVTPYGTTGPKAEWVATDLTMQAGGGVMAFSGTSDREPLKRGLFATTYEVGLTVAYVAEVGVYAAREGAGGTFADVSMSECVSSELVMTVPEYTFAGAISARRRATVDPFSAGAPLAVGDGFVTVQTNPQSGPAKFAEFFGEDRFNDPRFATAEGRSLHAAELEQVFTEALAGQDPRDFFADASRFGLLTGVLQSADQLLTSTQLAARHAFVEMPGTLGGKPWRMPSVLPGLRGAVTVRPAPALGEDNARLLDLQAVSP